MGKAWNRKNVWWKKGDPFERLWNIIDSKALCMIDKRFFVVVMLFIHNTFTNINMLNLEKLL